MRKKFQAQKVILNVSSHLYVARPMIPYLEILHRNLLPNIILDDATYLYGTYRLETGEECEQAIQDGRPYNYNKTSVFKERYFHDYDLLWFAIIDDTVNPEYIQEYKEHRPMLLCRPSQRNEDDLKYDNFMCHSSLTEGFDGVLDCVDQYIKSIQLIRKENIIDTQRKMLVHLSAFQIFTLCHNKEYDLLLQYIIEGKLDSDDYEQIAIVLSSQKDSLSQEELKDVRKVIQALVPFLENEEILKKLL